MNSPAKRVLVTGGTGFVGRHASESLLARGFDVHLVSRDPATARAAAPRQVVVHRGDLLQGSMPRALLRDIGPTHLLHLAWTTAHGKFWTSVENFAWVKASLDLIQDFVACGGRRIVCAGTCAEYDWSGEVCSEFTTPRCPATLYGACKNGLREMIERYAAGTGASAAWGRLFFLYGPDEPPARLVPSLMRPLARGERAECQSGNYVRDFLHTADAADAFVALLDSDLCGPVNIASGQPVRLATLAGLVAEIAGRSELMSTGTAHGSPDLHVLTADTRRLNEELGWRPRIALPSGLESLWQHNRHARAA